ncbi:PREDICTED: zinc finger MYM-type protein 3-like, partial [Mesitornis unicolor]|uniref:zinc finger MYM-type protein 3-like n=1 Tax=Mesitornis unicolor TaxID=54374 RepID=UPI0005281E5D
MDSSEFSGSLDPLSLPEKPLIGDLPADMEFGEDLLGSQTASTQEVSVLQPSDWDQSKQMTADGDLDLLVKTNSQSELSKPNDLVLDKPGVLGMLEKPDVSDDLDKPADLMELDKPEGLGEGLSGKGSELPTEKEQKRSERARRSETARLETVNSSESIPVSDEDSDAMVDDPNDEDFVPFRTRRSTRMSLRTQMAQRAARSTVTKMTCANCRTPLQKGQTAYQRKGLPQLFCSSSCLTTFSKKPPGKKICAFCK